MSMETIYDDINSGQTTFGPHLIEQMWKNGISIDQVLDTILNGTINKRERRMTVHMVNSLNLQFRKVILLSL